MMCHKIGRCPISIIGFGLIELSSVMRVPAPPARMTTFMDELQQTLRCPQKFCRTYRAVPFISKIRQEMHLPGLGDSNLDLMGRTEPGGIIVEIDFQGAANQPVL